MIIMALTSNSNSNNDSNHNNNNNSSNSNSNSSWSIISNHMFDNSSCNSYYCGLLFRREQLRGNQRWNKHPQQLASSQLFCFNTEIHTRNSLQALGCFVWTLKYKSAICCQTLAGARAEIMVYMRKLLGLLETRLARHTFTSIGIAETTLIN